LTKIRILVFNCRPAGDNPAQRFRSPDGEQNRKIFLTFFNCTPPKFFSIKEKSILLGSALNEQGGGATYSLGRLGIPPLNPPAEPSSLGQKDFLAAEFLNLG
jgi:hypothetical protein